MKILRCKYYFLSKLKPFLNNVNLPGKKSSLLHIGFLAYFKILRSNFAGEFGAEGGIIVVDTFDIMENDDVNLAVLVKKGTRSILMEQLMQVIDGNPPDIRIELVF